MNYTKDELMARGEYLVNVIDKLPDKATYHDIDNLPKGDHVVTYGPSSGKTTAIRQFIAKHFSDPGFTGVFATKLISDVADIRYDIISNIIYNNPKLDPIAVESAILGFSSDDKDITVRELQLSKWIICTHERLLIEPSSIICLRDLSSASMMKPDELYRNYLFIDEYPSNVYKEFKLRNLGNMLYFNSLACPDLPPDSIEADTRRAAYIDKVYKDNTRDQVLIGVLDNLPTPTNQNFSLDMKRGSNSSLSEFSRNRIEFFTNVLNHKYQELIKSDDPDEVSRTTSLYYDVSDLLIRNKYIFDGTGDLLLRGSKLWNIIEDDRFCRRLELYYPVRKVSTYVSRNDPTEVIGDEYVDSISQIANKHPDSKLIVYTWKASKDDLEQLDEYIMNHLDKSIADRVNMIHYMSGQERVTSKYSDSDVVVILGKFYIPRSAIQLMNNINKSNISMYDYTISLLMQLIYRSAARKGNPISLYITNDYSESFIDKLMSKYKYLTIRSENDSVLDSIICPVTKPDRLPELLHKIMNWNNLELRDDKLIIIKSTELAKCLGITYKWKNSDLKKRLQRNGINYEITKGQAGRGESSLFTIILPSNH